MARMTLVLDVVEEELRRERAGRQRELRDDLQIESMSDTEFVRTYRLTRVLFEELCCDVIPLLPAPSRRTAISPASKVLTALAFYATGSYQNCVGLNHNAPMSQQSVSKCISEVTGALNNSAMLEKFIRFPQCRAERDVLREKFYTRYHLPGVIGAIDCTHVAIVRPAANEERFYNRKHYHSINVQVICDTDLNILSVDASHGGATHDNFVWTYHEVKSHLEHLIASGEQALLLGDSGYAQRSYMMTPIEGARNGSAEAHYTELQKVARNTSERTFGVLKGRWRCLLVSRMLHYHPKTTGLITNACCVLHNFCNRRGLPATQLSAADIADEERLQIHENHVEADPRTNNVSVGRLARQRLVDELWRMRNIQTRGN